MGAAAFELLGLTVSEAVSFAVGVALGPALHPLTQELANDAWAAAVAAAVKADAGGPTHTVRPIEVSSLAAIVAESVEALGWGRDEAARQGISQADFDALFREAEEAPGIADLLAMLRRGTVKLLESDPGARPSFEHGLRKAKLEGRWDDALTELQHVRLSPAEIALGIVRSIIDDPGFLPTTLDTRGGQVPAYAQSDIAPLTEAAAAGIDKERLRVMVGSIGRPMGPESAASAVFRKIIDRADYNRAILEGDIRPEWASAIFDTARQIPSVADYVNARIRGWITEDEMHAGAERHGMSTEDVNLLYLRTGRPAAPGQMATAAARLIDGPDGTPMDRAQFLKGIAESDIRPEWGPMLWESRFLYPPLFQITRLVQAGAITADTARDWAIKDRYPPEVVNALLAYWQQPAVGKADPLVTKAQNQLWTTLHRTYIAGETDIAEAEASLGLLGASALAKSEVIALWENERELIRKQLTPADIRKGYQKMAINAATGAPWTLDDAVAALVSRGYTPTDAHSYLNLPLR